MSRKIIDTHIHNWDLHKAEYAWLNNDTSLLNRTYKIDEIEKDRIEANVAAGILVQAAPNFEDTDLMLEAAANTDWIAGIVGWLPLMDMETLIERLENKYLPNNYFKGVRHQIHDEVDTKWLLQPSIINSLKVLAKKNIPYDVVAVLPTHMETVLNVAKAVPDLKMILDHMSQPPIKTGEKFGTWGELMKEASKHKSCYVKISGLGTALGNSQLTTAAELKPYIEFVLEHFGVDRCMCGSDWPVALLAGSYSQTWQVYLQVLTELLSNEEQEKVLYSNAVSFYNLKLS